MSDEFDLDEYAEEVDELERNVERTDYERSSRNGRPVTPKHHARGVSLFKSFIDCAFQNKVS